jgi:predicted acyltransferase
MILVNNPGSWSHTYSPLKHAAWHGCTPTDLVFPFFLFAVGNAMAFVMPRLREAGDKVFLRKVLIRTLLIFGIGLFLNWSPFVRWSAEGELVFKHWVDPSNPENGIRILGVLQRIALAYLFASLIAYYLKPTAVVWVSLIILFVYWILCLAFGTPADPFSLNGYFGTTVDKTILGIPHMYKGEGVPFDPEGIASTLPAIVQVIIGYFAGNFIRRKGASYEMLARLFVAGTLLSFAGLVVDLGFPINKKIWSSSFVLYTSGLGIQVLCIVMYLIEFRSAKGAWSRFFDVFGKNPLFIFVLSGFLPRLLALFRWVDHTDDKGSPVYTNAFAWFYEHICKQLPGRPENGSLLYAVSMIMFFWAICYLLDKKKIYIRV